MGNVMAARRARTGFEITADDGTVARVRRVERQTVAGFPPGGRMYRAEILPAGKTAADVTLSRPLLKLLLRGGAKITARVPE